MDIISLKWRLMVCEREARKKYYKGRKSEGSVGVCDGEEGGDEKEDNGKFWSKEKYKFIF